MERQEIIEQLVQLEENCSNDYELGGLVWEFIRQNFEEGLIIDKHGNTSKNKS